MGLWQALHSPIYLGDFRAGGLGKTSLALVEAIAMATGRHLLGISVPKRLRVWYWNGEDPPKRPSAALPHFKISPEEIDGWLFVDTGRKTRLSSEPISGRPQYGAAHPTARLRFMDTWVKVSWNRYRTLAANDNIWFAALRALRPPYEGGEMWLHRGQCDGETVGPSWTWSWHIARKFALHGQR